MLTPAVDKVHMSTEPEPIQLAVQIDLGEDADLDELARAAFQLRAEVAETDVGSVELASAGPAPQGTMSGSGALIPGALTIQAHPGSISSLVRLLQAWMARAIAQPRRVRIVRGEGAGRIEVDLDANWLSDADLKALLDKLIQPPPTAGSSVAIQSEGDVTAGQDIVGRDKITHIHAGPGATIVVNPSPSSPPLPGPE